MNQPVRVGLEFPRSGQQLFVTVSRQVAEPFERERTDHKSQFPSLRILASDSTPAASSFPATQQ